MDHVFFSRTYGALWFYKFQKCKMGNCNSSSADCMWAHAGGEPMKRPLCLENFNMLSRELRALPGTFGGCVHSCCDVDSIPEAYQLVDWGHKSLDSRVYVAWTAQRQCRRCRFSKTVLQQSCKFNLHQQIRDAFCWFASNTWKHRYILHFEHITASRSRNQIPALQPRFSFDLWICPGRIVNMQRFDILQLYVIY
jgi:hypothetical protein